MHTIQQQSIPCQVRLSYMKVLRFDDFASERVISYDKFLEGGKFWECSERVKSAFKRRAFEPRPLSSLRL